MRHLSRKNPLDIKYASTIEKQNASPIVETETEDLRLNLSNIGYLSDQETHILPSSIVSVTLPLLQAPR